MNENRNPNPRNHKTRWKSELGIGGTVSPMATKLPKDIRDILRSLPPEKLVELCGEKSLSAYLRRAVINQMKIDELLPEDKSKNPSSDLATHTRKRKKATTEAM